jgi:hypothetical protein
MIAMHVEWAFTVEPSDDDLKNGYDLHRHGELLMEALLELEDDTVFDSATSTDLAAGLLVIELDVQAPDEAAALEIASAAIRTAIHKSGAATPAWPTMEDLKPILEYRSRSVNIATECV